MEGGLKKFTRQLKITIQKRRPSKRAIFLSLFLSPFPLFVYHFFLFFTLFHAYRQPHVRVGRTNIKYLVMKANTCYLFLFLLSR